MEGADGHSTHENSGSEPRNGPLPAWAGQGETGRDLETSPRKNSAWTRNHGWIFPAGSVGSETVTYKGTKYEK